MFYSSGDWYEGWWKGGRLCVGCMSLVISKMGICHFFILGRRGYLSLDAKEPVSFTVITSNSIRYEIKGHIIHGHIRC